MNKNRDPEAPYNSEPISPEHAPYSSDGWKVGYIQLPTVSPADPEDDIRNTIRVFNEQFGSPLVDFSSTVFKEFDSEYPVAILRSVEDSEGHPRYIPTLQARSIDIQRNLMLRLIAHEVEHAHIGGEKLWSELPVLSKLPSFNQLAQRVTNKAQSIREKLRNQNVEEHYGDPDEILARLRSYQIFIEELESIPEANQRYSDALTEHTDQEIDFQNVFTTDELEHLAIQPHEFLEIFRPADLRWLDDNYLQSQTQNLELPPPARAIRIEKSHQ